MSDTAVDTSAEISAKDLKEKKEVVEETENGRDAPANGNAGCLLLWRGEEVTALPDFPVWGRGGGCCLDTLVTSLLHAWRGEEEDGDEDDEAEGATGKRAAEDDEDDEVDPKKQKTDEDD
ncbi:prothymosin alpha [Alligator mississippiensis]|uniref:Prothymosin alpha n=1 Tax=Alligator mississippiensis TaxID=8496 RepID=A0A151MLD7_ALLMI|nr:prothymosin alpha [Alligator mississippiensis]